MSFLLFPPEINSALMYTGAGSGPLFAAAAAWQGLAAALHTTAESFDSIVTTVGRGPWSGPSSAAMTTAAMPYVSWLSAAAGQAEVTAAQARVAATTFEAAQTATVHPAAVTANRVSLTSLIATNFLGQNTPAIAATEFDYAEMWAQDVAAMVGYHADATSVAAGLAPFDPPPIDLAGLASQIGAQLADVAPAVFAEVQAVVSGAPLQSAESVAQVAMLPVSMLMSPLMSLAQGVNGAGATGAAAGLASGVSDAPKLVGDLAAPVQPPGKGGAAFGGGLGQGRLVGAMSVPPSWPGSAPKGTGGGLVSGLGTTPSATAEAQGLGMGGMPMMPMPMGMGGAGGSMPAAMMGRGGGGAHVVQNRPSVVPRTGVG
ncbi:PPE family protein [Mycobacterium sp. 1423905.2]|uniref:PPE family protein n=1 Tax=Mycobacterium sp. 1423905.2 TaxID=1856859 RepID=UPI0007FBD723|nr:PPE family protein [Mycobacterium sp. 1423905.2]OBJ55332.1 hypothetical protein A9W95_15255 [Mycobacterium sp. 1423905.2]